MFDCVGLTTPRCHATHRNFNAKDRASRHGTRVRASVLRDPSALRRNLVSILFSQYIYGPALPLARLLNTSNPLLILYSGQAQTPQRELSMAEMDSPTSASPAKKKKNLPFKRTIARKKSPDPFSDDLRPGKANSSARNGGANDDDDDDDDGISMFRRRNEVFPLAIEEQQRRLKKEESRKKASTVSTNERGDPEEQDTKRRRISTNWDSDDDLPSSGGRRASKRFGPFFVLFYYTTNNTHVNRSSTPRSTAGYVPSKILSPVPGFGDIKKDVEGKGKQIARHEDFQSPRASKTRKTSDCPVNLDDDDLGIPATPKAILETETTKLVEPETIKSVLIVDDDSDQFADEPTLGQPGPEAGFGDDDDDLAVLEEPPDEFSKYVVQAREREAKANAAKASASEAVDNLGKVTRDATNTTAASRPTDTSIKVMVSSLLPDTVPMVAKLKITQAISVVRDAWFDQQKNKAVSIPDDIQGQIFLTWKGNRVYNTITCASLGLEVDALGRVRWHTYDGDEAGYHNGGLHFQAWTEELYAQYVKKKERERLRSLGELDEDSEPAAAGQAEAEQEEEGPKPIRVTLKAKDCEPLNTKVHMHTTAETMVTVFRDQRSVPPEKEAALYFDGEKLDGATTVEDAGIEDMDNLEVHIK